MSLFQSHSVEDPNNMHVNASSLGCGEFVSRDQLLLPVLGQPAVADGTEYPYRINLIGIPPVSSPPPGKQKQTRCYDQYITLVQIRLVRMDASWLSACHACFLSVGSRLECPLAHHNSVLSWLLYTCATLWSAAYSV